MQIETAARQFLAYVERERGCTAATARAYGSDLRRCIAYLVGAGVDLDTDALTPAVLREYVGWMAREGLVGATIRRRVSTVSSLFAWLIYCEHSATNPCLSVALPKKCGTISGSRVSTQPSFANITNTGTIVTWNGSIIVPTMM